MRIKNLYLLFLVVFLSYSNFSCGLIFVKGNGIITYKEVKIEEFDKLIVTHHISVYHNVGSTYNLVIETDENILPLVEVVANPDKSLKLSLSKNSVYPSREDDGIKITITSPEFSNLQLSGNSECTLSDFNINYFDCEVSGSSDLDINRFNVSKLNINSSGASDIDITNSSHDTLNIASSGDSDSDIKLTKLDIINVILSGSSSLELNCGTINTVKIEASGSSEVSLKTGNISNLLDLGLSGSSEFEMERGTIKNAKLTLTGASSAELEHVQIENIEKSVSGFSEVKL